MNDNYEAMSNRRIDRKIVDILFGTDDKDINRIFNEGRFAYCNNWNDIMPIAVEHRISVKWYEDAVGIYCHASSRDDDIGPYFYHDDESPQRAIAICFLKLKDAQNEPR